MTDRPIWGLALAVILVGACGGAENRPATWTYISPAILQPTCATASCHNKTAAVAGLDLSDIDDGYKSLMNQKLPNRAMAAGGPPARQMVIPGNPEQSRLINSLRAIGANRMPPDRPLAEADIDLIESWILNGAKND